MRTIADLPEEQVRGLDLWCKREGISRTEAVRRAIRIALSSQSSGPRRDAFGAWAGKKMNSGKFVEARRAEWNI